ncbi:Fe2+-dicitrate sensor protein [Echinicola strongylocentroti]|uniref:Fe2+-dicitrate sensor protein n=2 Tax=Echinicola strongylocentroti TaxID=1795355 RepID=A0A2Z4IR73_9BACT|nr:Fe2+-dicitrate sensor protein [Echinicola strongylocentroti]
MKYSQFDIEDFLNDEFFIRWVKKPSDETDHFWLKWIAEHPDKIHLIQKAREVILFVDYKDSYCLSDKTYTDLYESIISETPPKSSKPTLHIRWRGWHKVAAILLVTFSSVYCFKFYLEDREATSLSQDEVVVKYNPAGQKSSFRLPDGTVVYLNAKSKLSYPVTFSGDVRKVTMEGEAYFEVKKDNARPFVVDLGEEKVRVTGTSFNLCSFKGFLSVALVEGGVTYVSQKGDMEQLQPNEMLTKVPHGAVSKRQFDPLEICGWKDNYLIFKDDPFDKVVMKLERWYGVKISSKLTLNADWSYSGTYHDKSLEYVLEGIGIASEFAYAIEGKNVTIYNPKQQ